MNGSAKGANAAGQIQLVWPFRLCVLAAIIAADYFAGTSLFSSSRMEPLFYPIFRSLFHISEASQLYDYLSALRHAVHSLEYFVLFLLAVWLVGLRPLPALLFCVLLAVADEGHQYFLPDRTCSLRDLNFDTVGAATAWVLTIAARRLRSAPHLQTVVTMPRVDRQ